MKNYIHARTCVYNINYHFVWCVKYRKKVLNDNVTARLYALIQSIAEEIVHKEVDGIEKPFKLKDDPDLANRITNAIVKQLGLLPKKSEDEKKSFNFYYAVHACVIEKGEASAELSLSCYYNDQKDGTLKIKVDHPFLNVIVYIVGFQFAEPEK